MSDNSLELDILRELFNISVGKASSLLSEIIERKIILKVPDIKLVSLENNNKEEFLSENSDGIYMISSISFERDLQGKASLIFSVKKMRTFIDLCLKNYGSEEYFDMNFSDVDFDVIKEIGNIVLNSVIGEVGNLLNLKVSYTLPEVQIYNGSEFLKDIDGKFTHVLKLNITFLIENTKIEGAIFVHLTINSFSDIMEKIKKIEDELHE